MKKILILIGTRPNFIKITQFKKIAENYDNIEVKIVHTGQHYDANMADIFFQQFGLQPDYFLNIGPASPNTQMASIMLKLEELMTNEYKPDLLIVPGDVNSTFAGALTANKMGVKLAHLESGLRSCDRTMPEEINRLLTDEVADYYFVTEQSGLDALKKEGKKGEVYFAGNTMIDTLVAYEDQIDNSDILEQYKLDQKGYVLMTIHRPQNVDSKGDILKLLELIELLSERYKIVFPIHPRTIKRMEEYQLRERFSILKNLVQSGPMGYFEFQKLVKYSKVVLTDSGGIQEETTFRQIPCLTLRPNTERPSTVTIGTNTLIPFDIEVIRDYLNQIEASTYKKGNIPLLWDGKSTERIMEFISTRV